MERVDKFQEHTKGRMRMSCNDGGRTQKKKKLGRRVKGKGEVRRRRTRTVEGLRPAERMREESRRKEGRGGTDEGEERGSER